MRAALAGAMLFAAPVAAGELALGLPIGCDLGATCHIQQYVDRDPGPAARDYRCGSLSYDGHKGTDFAVPTLADMQRGVTVLAAAAGVVAGTRDGMADTGLNPQTAKSIAGRDCGNGVLIRHPDGWETQYCHMKSGSVRVRKGDRVDRGAILGLVGQSGRAQFPHVHLSVRHDGAVVDPFDTSAKPSCGANPPDLWQQSPAYRPGGLIEAGFSASIPDYGAVKAGTAAQPALATDAPALVLFGFAFGGRKGDVIEMSITGPQGPVMQQQATLDKDQAQFFRAAGKRLTGPGWPAGQYSGTVVMQRGGRELNRKVTKLTIR